MKRIKTLELFNSWTATLLVIITLMIALSISSCQSQSGKRLENRVSERCVVIDSFTLGVDDAPDRTYIKLLRVSDNTIHSQVTHQSKLYECGDTIIIHFDKRYDY